MSIARPLRLAILLAALLVPVGAAQAASIWVPVNTGLPSSDTITAITAIAGPTGNEIVLVTGGGRILHGPLDGLAAASVTPSNPTGFNDVAMSPDGGKGIAVGGSGQIYRSTDSGASWSPVTGTQEYNNADCSSSPSGNLPALGALSDDLSTVKFADASTVYITGKHRDALKSTDGGATFTEVNKKADGTCVAPGMGGDFTGQQWLDANHGYLIDDDFGQYFTTINGLATANNQTAEFAGSVNLGRARLAIDPSIPSHAWAISDGHQDTSYFQYTTDNGANWHPPTYDGNQFSFQDIAFDAGTVVAVGKQGDIYTSADGKSFNRQIADPPLNANDWETVAMLDASHALVGGAGGALLSTAKANQTPDSVAPTGTIGGPASLAIGQFGTYTANATDNLGGSGIDPASFSWSATGVSGTQSGRTARFAFTTPGTHVVTVSFKDLGGNAATATVMVTVSPPPPVQAGAQSATTGGGTVGTAKKLTVTGHQHIIPVRVSSKAPRGFVLTLVTLKGRRHYVPALKVMLKHAGKRTATIKLPANVKPGSYLLLVRVFTLGGHGLGRQITLVLVLA